MVFLLQLYTYLVVESDERITEYDYTMAVSKENLNKVSCLTFFQQPVRYSCTCVIVVE